LRYYLEYRQEVITRRTQYDLRRAETRAHVLEGLTIALDHIDAVIAIIRAASTTEAAQQTLMDRFGLTETQADAILALQLRRLVALERRKVADELADLRRTIADLQGILADPARVRALIREEFLALKERFGDERRTTILVGASESLSDADLVPDMSVAVVVTQRGYVKRMPLHYYRAQNRGGRGVIGATTRDDDLVARLFVTHTHDSLLLFTTHSRVLRTHVYELPDASRTARGASLVNFVALEPEERIATVLPLAAFHDDAYLIQATTHGEVKRTPLAAYATARQAGVKTMGLEPGDELCGVLLTSGQDDVVVVTASGRGIRFHETELRSSGRTSGGVRGIRLAAVDRIVGLVRADEAGALLLVTDQGYGKKTLAREFRPKHRGGQGVRALRTDDKVGQVVGCATVRSGDTEILAVSADGLMLRVPLDLIRLSGRYSQGTRLINLKAGDRLSSIAIISQEDLEMAVPPEINGASNGAALNGDAAPDNA
jgi:DNA gyrase subunit A